MEQDEMVPDLALKLDLANMELQTIDEVHARRPALAGLKHRTEKIEHMCRVNGELLDTLEELHRKWHDLHDTFAKEPDRMKCGMTHCAKIAAVIRKAKEQ
jgi:hypothetical protein